MRYWRIVNQPDSARPWVVQGDTETPGIWADIARFHEHEDARRYIADITERQRRMSG